MQVFKYTPAQAFANHLVFLNFILLGFLHYSLLAGAFSSVVSLTMLILFICL